MSVLLTRRQRKGARGGDARHVRRAVRATLDAEGIQDREVSVLLTDDREIQELNLGYRGMDKPTDVLAFALDEAEGGDLDPSLGDVVISVQRAEAQAGSRKVTLDAELELLAVHGTLHLLGYDHAKAEEAKLMRARTRTIRRGLLPLRPDRR